MLQPQSSPAACNTAGRALSQYMSLERMSLGELLGEGRMCVRRDPGWGLEGGGWKRDRECENAGGQPGFSPALV